jgi:flagella basal body P-ring formation protein FlgA
MPIPAWAAGISVSVPAESTVQGPSIILGEIADISGDDETKVNALRALKLGSAPQPGGRMVLTRELLGSRLAAAGSDLSGITWMVPEYVTLSTAAQTVSGRNLAETALEAVEQRISAASEDIDIELVGYPADILAPVGSVTLQADLPHGIRKNGPTIANVTVSTNGHTFTKVSLRYNVKIYADIVVAAKPLNAHEPLTPENLTLQRLDTLSLNSSYITDRNKLVGLSAKRFLAAGTVINDMVVEKPVIVKRGSSVTITARSGVMEVTAAGQALQDGVEGQIIRVQNINSRRILTARVVDEGLVQVITIK